MTIAKTPVMRSRKMEKVLEAPENSTTGPEAHPASPKGKEFKGNPPATWLRLLQHVGLQDLDIEDDDLKITPADYLPDDILAVPAYADLGFIVAVTAASGAYSFKIGSQSAYPIIIGDGFQFDFRQHPTLGIVGAFSNYGQEIQSTDYPPPSEIVLALRHSRGDIDIGPSFLPNSTTTGEKSSERFNVFLPFEPHDILATMTEHECTHGSALCEIELEDHSAKTWTDDYHHLLWILLAKLPDNIPSVFPSNQTNFQKVLQILALNSPFWSNPNGSGERPDKPSFMTELGTGKSYSFKTTILVLPEHPSNDELKGLLLFIRQISKIDKAGKEIWEPCEFFNDHLNTWWRNIKTSSYRSNIFLRNIFEESLNFLRRPDDSMAWFNAMIGARKLYFRLLVLLQLQNIDWRLKRENEDSAISCRVFSLWYTTLALLDSERAILDNDFEDLKSHDGEQTRWDCLNVDNGPQNNLLVCHFNTIKSLGSFLDILDPSKLSPTIQQYRAKFLSIFKSQLDWGELSRNFKREAVVLCRLKQILDSSYNTVSKSGWVRHSKQSGNEVKDVAQPGVVKSQREEGDNSNVGGEKTDGWKQLEKRMLEPRWPHRPHRGHGERGEPGTGAKPEPKHSRRLEMIDDLIIFRVHFIMPLILHCTGQQRDVVFGGMGACHPNYIVSFKAQYIYREYFVIIPYKVMHTFISTSIEKATNSLRA